MESTNQKFVDFKTYCPLCKNAKLDEHKDPCNDCLNCPTNTNTHQPILFEEA